MDVVHRNSLCLNNIHPNALFSFSSCHTAYLSCERGEMVVKINFSAPFRGVAYSDYDRTSPCKFYGDGSKYYEMRLPLKGCGTKQVCEMIRHTMFSLFPVSFCDESTGTVAPSSRCIPFLSSLSLIVLITKSAEPFHAHTIVILLRKGSQRLGSLPAERKLQLSRSVCGVRGDES